MDSKLRCRGCWFLGNNCGECGDCQESATEGVQRIRELNDEVARLQFANRTLAEANLRAKDEARADFEELRQLVIDVRKYVISHGLLLGECVAWDKLKQLTGVGQTADCPSEKGNGG